MDRQTRRGWEEQVLLRWNLLGKLELGSQTPMRKKQNSKCKVKERCDKEFGLFGMTGVYGPCKKTVTDKAEN